MDVCRKQHIHGIIHRAEFVIANPSAVQYSGWLFTFRWVQPLCAKKYLQLKLFFHDYLIQNVLRLKVISVGWIINLSLCSLHPLPANPLSYRQWLIQPTTIICTTPVEEKSNRESCAPKLSARTAGKQRKCFTIHYVWF